MLLIKKHGHAEKGLQISAERDFQTDVFGTCYRKCEKNSTI